MSRQSTGTRHSTVLTLSSSGSGRRTTSTSPSTSKTDIYEGYGELVDDTTIEIVDGPDKGIRITGEKTLVATGSSPWVLPIDGLDGVDYYTSETILKERNLPGSIVIIGGGYIALEWGQILHRIGVDVTILQRSERVLSGMEGQLGREMQRAFEEEGIKGDHRERLPARPRASSRRRRRRDTVRRGHRDACRRQRAHGHGRCAVRRNWRPAQQRGYRP